MRDALLLLLSNKAGWTLSNLVEGSGLGPEEVRFLLIDIVKWNHARTDANELYFITDAGLTELHTRRLSDRHFVVLNALTGGEQTDYTLSNLLGGANDTDRIVDFLVSEGLIKRHRESTQAGLKTSYSLTAVGKEELDRFQAS